MNYRASQENYCLPGTGSSRSKARFVSTSPAPDHRQDILAFNPGKTSYGWLGKTGLVS